MPEMFSQFISYYTKVRKDENKWINDMLGVFYNIARQTRANETITSKILKEDTLKQLIDLLKNVGSSSDQINIVKLILAFTSKLNTEQEIDFNEFFWKKYFNIDIGHVQIVNTFDKKAILDAVCSFLKVFNAKNETAFVRKEFRGIFLNNETKEVLPGQNMLVLNKTFGVFKFRFDNCEVELYNEIVHSITINDNLIKFELQRYPVVHRNEKVVSDLDNITSIKFELDEMFNISQMGKVISL